MQCNTSTSLSQSKPRDISPARNSPHHQVASRQMSNQVWRRKRSGPAGRSQPIGPKERVEYRKYILAGSNRIRDPPFLRSAEAQRPHHTENEPQPRDLGITARRVLITKNELHIFPPHPYMNPASSPTVDQQSSRREFPMSQFYDTIRLLRRRLSSPWTLDLLARRKASTTPEYQALRSSSDISILEPTSVSSSP